MKNLIIGGIAFVVLAVLAVVLFLTINSDQEEIPVPAPAPVETPVEKPEKKPEVPAPKDLVYYFDYNKAKLKSDANADNRIAEFKTWLADNPESMVVITGHADEIGPSDYNQYLGLKRAVAVENHLTDKGFAGSKLIAGSKGETMPVGDQSTREGRAKNRRAVITIIK